MIGHVFNLHAMLRVGFRLGANSIVEQEFVGTGQRPLLGTALLKNHSLFVQFTDLGRVDVEKL